MVISLCGNRNSVIYAINELSKIYKDKLLVCDIWKEEFNTKIDSEKYKYELLDKHKNLDEARKKHVHYITETVNNKVNTILDENKDKIIILIGNCILSNDINKTIFFNKSNLKILITNRNTSDMYSPFNHKFLYKKENFDYVIYDDEKDKIKELIKL